MKTKLFTFQEEAVDNLHKKINNARQSLMDDTTPQIISFSAPTGAGKTIMMTKLFEDILYGYDGDIGDPDAVILWLSDAPELNEQTRLKIETQSDKIPIRSLTTIDTSFNAEYFDGGNIYFLNTQKLGSEKLLTKISDNRDYSIWETIENTAKRSPRNFYVVIDEAHRGTFNNTQAENKAQSIMQKFILGSDGDSLSPLPLIVGITATPERFNKLVEGSSSTVYKVPVKVEDVRDSGLLKDRIMIDFPEIQLQADMSMLQKATQNWMKKCDHWKNYCDSQKEEYIEPILVVQVADGNDSQVSATNLDDCISTIEQEYGRRLQEFEVAHTFNDRDEIVANGLTIHRIEASRIKDDMRVKVVLFKMNLSTGWDCPRAETMMSFRTANDATYIAQLLGRMIRTPLARRIEIDDELNNVQLFLPYFDKNNVENVINALNEDTAITSDVGSAKDLVTLEKNHAFDDVFNAIKEQDIKTYQIDVAKKQPPIRTYINLAFLLTKDEIDSEAYRASIRDMLDQIEAEVAEIQNNENYMDRISSLMNMKVGTAVFDYGGTAITIDSNTGEVSVSPYDIKRQFERSGKLLGSGLHMEFFARHNSEGDDTMHRINIILLTSDESAMKRLNDYADKKFAELFNKYQNTFIELPEKQKDKYLRIVRSSATPQPVSWELPDSIGFTTREGDGVFERHMYCDENGQVKLPLNSWESGVIEEELRNGAVCWLRNLDRKTWSMAIPYEVNGKPLPLFPDLVVANNIDGKIRFSILEPHDPSLKDNYQKALGMAKFAAQHSGMFERIELIRKDNGADGIPHFYRLDMAKLQIREKVIGIRSNEELDKIFDEHKTNLG